MSDHSEAIASALELPLINQSGIGAAIEELAKWVAKRGPIDTAESAVVAPQVLNLNAEAIASAIRVLRQE